MTWLHISAYLVLMAVTTRAVYTSITRRKRSKADGTGQSERATGNSPSSTSSSDSKHSMDSASDSKQPGSGDFGAFHAVLLPVIVCDFSMHIVYVNPACTSVFGWNSEELLRAPVSALSSIHATQITCTGGNTYV